MFSPILSLMVQPSFLVLTLVLPVVLHSAQLSLASSAASLPTLPPALPPAEFHPMLLPAVYQPTLPPAVYQPALPPAVYCPLLLPAATVVEQHLTEILQDIEQIFRKLANASTSKQSVVVRAKIILYCGRKKNSTCGDGYHRV